MINVVLFAGFLGAGKTTLLGRLLPTIAGSRRTALLVNDFGKLAIDAALLDRHGVPMRAIAGGSIFCVCKQADLLRQLTDLATEIRPELLLIEASGLAEPTDAAALLQSTFLREMYARPKVVTVVDAVNFLRLSHGLRVLDRQVEVADVLVVAKSDLADPAPVEQRLRELNPAARIVLSDLNGLRDDIDWHSEGRVEADAPARLCATATPGFSTVNLSAADADAIRLEKLNALLDEFKDVLLRGKGVLQGRRLDLVNGTYIWIDEAPDAMGDGLFFALKGDAATTFEARLNQIIPRK